MFDLVIACCFVACFLVAVLCICLWSKRHKALWEQKVLRSKGLTNLEMLISTYPPHKYFYKVPEYTDFISYSRKVFGEDLSKIYMRPHDYGRLIYSLKVDGCSAWVEWLKDYITKKDINLKKQNLMVRANTGGRFDVTTI